MQRGGPLFTAAVLAAAHALAIPRSAAAATYAVGPGRPYPDLASVARLLHPGDRVELDGGATYPGDVVLREPGTRDAPITITGLRLGGLRPILAGGATTLEVRADHYVIEGLDIQGGTSRCLYHHGDDLTVRDVVVHDCPGHGILSADDDAGSLTLSYVEVHHAGRGDSAHPIYVASDENAFPGSVFRMEHCFVHDGQGGNNVKSRAERNEIYGNWIEGARYHALELIGPDGATGSQRRAREDSDVVGNVLLKSGPGYAIRVGGDGSGETFGRYRFLNNTIVLGPEAKAVFRLFNGLESVEMDNNAMLREGGGPLRVVVEQEVRWSTGSPLVAGSTNWVPAGSTGVPPSWKHTLRGDDPGLVSLHDPRPVAGSPLVGAGTSDPKGPPGFAIPRPLAAPRALPPRGAIERIGAAVPRLRGCLDIGAFPFEEPPHPAASPRPPAAPPLPSGAPPPPPPPRACTPGCAYASAAGAGPLAALVVSAAMIARAIARRRARVSARGPSC